MTAAAAGSWLARRFGRPKLAAAVPTAAGGGRRRSLAGAGLLIVALAAAGWLVVRWLDDRGDAVSGILDPNSVSVDRLLAVFQDTRQYLQAARWHAEGGTFAPNVDGASGRRLGPRKVAMFVVKAPVHVARFAWNRLLRRRRRLLEQRVKGSAGGPPGEDVQQQQLQQQQQQQQQRPPRRLQHFQKSSVRLPRGKACGSSNIRELFHIEATLPGVDPKFLMEIMTSPAYGIKWNPSVRSIVYRQRRHVKQDAKLPEVFSADAMRNPLGGASGKLLLNSGNTFDVTAQVSEIPIPRVLASLAGGRRYTADFIAARFDCEARRGFTIATSYGTEAVAEAAGVQKAQELCLSTMMLAPYEEAWNGTRLHIVTHFDAQVPQAFRKIVNANVGKSLRAMMAAMHKKALAVQATGKHPYIDCP